MYSLAPYQLDHNDAVTGESLHGFHHDLLVDVAENKSDINKVIQQILGLGFIIYTLVCSAVK